MLILLTSNSETSTHTLVGLPPQKNALLLENWMLPFTETFDSEAYTTPMENRR